jgi:Fe-S cluster assembly protein SufD
MVTHPETAPYLDAFRARTQAAEPHWLAAAREAALARFAALGFPSRRDEAWRFTDLRPLERGTFPPSAKAPGADADIARWRFAGPSHRIVLVDGRYAPALSAVGPLPRGAFLGPLGEAPPELVAAAFDPAIDGADAAQSFVALNAAFWSDGFVLSLPEGATLDRPVEIIHLGSGDASYHLRNAVLLGKGSAATLIETYAGGQHWTNAVAVLRLAPGASLVHAAIGDEAGQHTGLAHAVLEERAAYRAFLLTTGGRLARRDVLVRFAGAGAECRLDGATLLDGEREATIATFVDHAAPKCITRELFKAVVDGRAHGAFLGRIAVRPEGQQADAQQVSRNLLLSRRASVDTKPELEILADDVKCSHGATVGDLDESQIFYLRSRGLAEEDARRLLIEAFLLETLDRVEETALRAHLTRHLVRALGGGEAAP